MCKMCIIMHDHFVCDYMYVVIYVFVCKCVHMNVCDDCVSICKHMYTHACKNGFMHVCT